MALDELARHELHSRLRETLGEPAATTLMEYLPPTGWADVATKRDLDAQAVATRRDLEALSAELRHDMEALGAELRHDMEALGAELRHDVQAVSTDLRHDMEALGTDLRHDMEALGTDLRHDMQALEGRFDTKFEQLRADVRGEINVAFTSQTRTMILALVTSNLTVAGIAFAAAALH